MTPLAKVMIFIFSSFAKESCLLLKKWENFESLKWSHTVFLKENESFTLKLTQ
jgi:hypothetical protein